MSGKPEIWFYHLERSTLDQVLPTLLEKTLERGWRALIKSALRLPGADQDSEDPLPGLIGLILDAIGAARCSRRSALARHPVDQQTLTVCGELLFDLLGR